MRAFLAGRSITMRPTDALRSFLRRNSRTSRSSRSMREKAGPVGNQRELQLRGTGRRKPVGWIFWPMGYLFLGFADRLVADRDENVARLLADTCAAARRARRQPAQRGRLFDQDAGDAQLVNVSTVVVLGIRDRGFERLLDDSRRPLLSETEDVQRLVDRLAADQVGDHPGLLGPQPYAPPP